MKEAFVGTNFENQKEVDYNLNSLTQHAAILGTTGSGKTVMCKVVIEEALANGIPVIAIDPKGDIAGLGITSKTFDFRPFTQDAEKTQKAYFSNFKNTKKISLDKLSKIKTTVFTPKSSVGISVNLIPDLSVPNHFKETYERDQTFAVSIIEPLAESLCNLAEIRSGKEKAKSLISSLILYNWNKEISLTLETIIPQIITPPFENLGTLALEDFLKEPERKKIASSINLILSSPSKQAWKSGHRIDIEKMYSPDTLSVFDLRYAGSMEDKQYAVEQILDKIYRYLINKGGSEKLKYILYIDEIAGLFPAPPSNPPCKKVLETLIRQARAFGLGIILATQNPGDIDYKVLGNIGTRFIGKLRTDNDIEKVSTAIGISQSTLKQALLGFNTGDFYYNNAVENKSMKIHARWLYSYHSGPLSEKEIKWLNHPETKPKVENELSLPAIATIEKNPLPKNYTSPTILKLKKQVQKYSDKTDIFTTTKNASKYKIFLQIDLEPRTFKGKNFESIGPYLYEISSKDSTSDLPEGVSWIKIAKYNYQVLPLRRSVKRLIYRSIKEAQQSLKKKVYSSKVIDGVVEDKNHVIKSNYEFMKQELESAERLLKEKARIVEERIEKKLKANNRKIDSLLLKTRGIKAGRLIRKIFGNKRLSHKPKKIKRLERKINKLKEKSRNIRKKIKKHREETRDGVKNLERKLYQQSHTLTKSIMYNPSKKDLVVKTKILLVPTN